MTAIWIILLTILGMTLAGGIFFLGMVTGYLFLERAQKKTGEYHDDKTLDKVQAALMKRDTGVFACSPEGAQDLIRKMQNAGILFRERV